MKSKIRFENQKLRRVFYELENKDPNLFSRINIVLDKIENNAFCGTQIPKKLFPKQWDKYSNLWKLNISSSWRLIYTIAPPDRQGDVIVLAIVLDYLSHKEYERTFKY